MQYPHNQKDLMMTRASVFVLLLLFPCLSGCAPRVKVKPHPSPYDKGIRYYRPKPYLLVTSAGESSTTKSGEITTTPNERFVNIQLQYLPDFEEEYAIEVKSGMGIADVNIALEDGWNLTSINQKLDSQTDENLQAAASLMSSIGKVAATGASADASGRENAPPAFEVRATNVPLGYYESVIGRDGCGRKRLYGFRYVGFLPFQACPVAMTGADCGNCQSTEVYGLVFDRGVMTFKSLAQIQQLPSHEMIVEAAQPTEPVNVQRILTYKASGTPQEITVNVEDKFPVHKEADGTLKVAVPRLKP